VGFKLPAGQTGGVVSAVEVLVAPGRLALPHRHEREDELCLVMDGQVGWRIGDQELLADPQSLTFLPRGVPHAYWNPGRSRAPRRPRPPPRRRARRAGVPRPTRRDKHLHEAEH
jgi:quercetin dioxygenase-like cupin family protein